jgi:hypothetical protein
MEKCHPYLFSLDRQNLNEDECKKIDELYECGVERGFLTEDGIDDDIEGEIEDGIDDENIDCDDNLCGGPKDALTNQEFQDVSPSTPEKNPLFTILYTSIKNGEHKSGEFYSYCTTEPDAKNDCLR